MTFEEWIAGKMDRGLSQLEVDQMRAAWDAATNWERDRCEALRSVLRVIRKISLHKQRRSNA
jgi:hypothetical protein